MSMYYFWVRANAEIILATIILCMRENFTEMPVFCYNMGGVCIPEDIIDSFSISETNLESNFE